MSNGHTDAVDAPLPQDFPEEPRGLEFDTRQYLDILRRRWWWVLGAGLVAIAAAWAYNRSQIPYPVFTAEALVQRIQESAGLFEEGSGLVPPQSPVGSDLRILRTQSVLGEVVDSTGLRLTVLEPHGIRSRLFSRVQVAQEAADREYVLQRKDGGVALLSGGQEVASSLADGTVTGPGLVLEVADPSVIPADGVRIRVSDRRSAIDELDESMQARQVSGTELIRISYEGADPVLTAVVANGIARAYQAQAATRARREAERRREWIAQRLTSVTDSLDEAQATLLQFQSERQTLDPRSEGASLSGLLSRAREQLRAEEERERVLEEVIATLQDGDRDALRQVMIFQGEMLPGGQGLYDRLREYEERRAGLVTIQRRTVNSPDVQLLDSLIAETRAVMIQTADQSLRRAREGRARAEARVSELRSQFGDVPERSIAFGRLEQRVERIQAMHDMLAGSLYEAQITEAVEAGNVQIIDHAVVPPAPSSMRGGGGTSPLIALMLGLLAGLMLAVGYEKLDTRIRRPDDARIASGAAIIGTIPTVSGDGWVIVEQQGTSASEAFRMLRTNLRFARAEDLRSIAITSPGPQEGKSMISANLAIALAQQGKRILLLDCDLRRPVQHTVFDQPKSPGFADLLVGDSRAECIRKLPQGIHLVTAGTTVPNPAELLGSEAFRRFLGRAREHYDLVVLDTPPVLAVSDTSVIAGEVDGVLLVARQQKTHRQALASAAAQLRASRAVLLGVAVNGVPTGRGYGPYGYGYGYGASEYLPETNGDPKRARSKAASRGT